MSSDWKNKCDNCPAEGKSIARIFYMRVNGKWVYLCPKCWELINKEMRKSVTDIKVN